MDGDLTLSRGQRRLLAAYRRWGPGALVRGITALSVVLSVVLVALSWLAQSPPRSSLVMDLAVAVLVPLIVAPLMSTVSVNLLGVVAQAYDRLSIVASTDALTGLPNRRHFFEAAERMTAALEAGQSLVVSMIDVNWFKEVNDTWGHAVGDAALIAVAERLTRVGCAGAVAARLGGDEFAWLAPAPPDGVQPLLRALTSAVGRVRVRDDVVVSASLGFARITTGTTVDDALALADAELYAAKQGRSPATRTAQRH